MVEAQVCASLGFSKVDHFVTCCGALARLRPMHAVNHWVRNDLMAVAGK